MNLALWIVAGALAAVFAARETLKLVRTPEKLVASGLGGPATSVRPRSSYRRSQLLGALGLYLPAALHIAPVLVPLAGVGLAVTMVGAAVVHGRRKEMPMVAGNVVLLALALFVAWGRFGRYPFA